MHCNLIGIHRVNKVRDGKYCIRSQLRDAQVREELRLLEFKEWMYERTFMRERDSHVPSNSHLFFMSSRQGGKAKPLKVRNGFRYSAPGLIRSFRPQRKIRRRKQRKIKHSKKRRSKSNHN
jgi:hypothetical protein